MGLTQTVAPAIEPVTLAEMQTQLRIDSGLDDSTLSILITAARENVEHYQKRQHITATWAMTLDAFPSGDIVLPWPPLIAISSISYEDVAGATQTWLSANYQVDITGEYGTVSPIPTATYPSTEAGRKNAVTVTYTAGYGTTASDVPQSTRLAVMMLGAHWYENREPVVVGTISSELPLHVKTLIDAEAIKAF